MEVKTLGRENVGVVAVERMVRQMTNEKRLIDAQPIVQFIMDGLNNPDKMKALGHDAIEILAEIEYAPTVDAVEVVHGRWIEKVGRAKCSVCADECWADSAMGYNYCPNCGAKMDGDGNA